MLGAMLAAFLAVSAGTGQCKAPRPVPPGLAPGSTYEYDGYPPIRFQGEAGTTVVTGDVAGSCGVAPCGFVTEACTILNGQQAVIHLPNPCSGEFTGEKFARLFCHEKGHALGWPASHGN